MKDEYKGRFLKNNLSPLGILSMEMTVVADAIRKLKSVSSLPEIGPRS